MADPQSYADALAQVAVLTQQISALKDTWADKSAPLSPQTATQVKCSPEKGAVVISGKDAIGKPVSISLSIEEAKALHTFLMSIGVVGAA